MPAQGPDRGDLAGLAPSASRSWDRRESSAATSAGVSRSSSGPRTSTRCLPRRMPPEAAGRSLRLSSRLYTFVQNGPPGLGYDPPERTTCPGRLTAESATLSVAHRNSYSGR